MTEHHRHQHVEVRDGDRTVAAAEVTTPQASEGTVRVSLHAESGHMAPGSRARLVDAVLDLPEVREGARLEAALPLGDGECTGPAQGAMRGHEHSPSWGQCARRGESSLR